MRDLHVGLEMLIIDVERQPVWHSSLSEFLRKTHDSKTCYCAMVRTLDLMCRDNATSVDGSFTRLAAYQGSVLVVCRVETSS